MSIRLAGLEHQRDEAKKMIELRDRVNRLGENKDFRDIILDGFCGKDSARLVHESGDPALSPQQRADALAMAQAGGHLRRYLVVILQQAEQFESNLAALEEAIEEERAAEDVVDATDDPGSVN